MPSRPLSVTLTEPEAAAARTLAAQQGMPLGDTVREVALEFARDHGFRDEGPPNLWQRKSPFWGPPPAEPAMVRLELAVSDAELALLTNAAAYFKFQAPQGGFADVTMSRFVGVALLRAQKKPRGAVPTPTPSATPSRTKTADRSPVLARPSEKSNAPPPPTRQTAKPPSPSLLGAEGKYVLIVAVGVTALVLGAVILKKLDERSRGAVTVASAAPAGQSSNARTEDEEPDRASIRGSAYRRPVYYGKSPLPSRAAASNIDALLEQSYGRPTVPADALRDASGSGPMWLAGAPTPSKDKPFEALAGLLKALPRHQMYDVAIASAIVDVAAIYPVPPALVKAIIRRESDFNPKAQSKVGAIGLMQVMPFNAKRVGLAEKDLWDPEKNILAGVRLMAVLLKYYQGDVISALTAYNARPRELFAPVPQNGETPAYIAHVLKYYEEFHGAPLREGLASSGSKGPGSAPLPPFATTRGE